MHVYKYTYLLHIRGPVTVPRLSCFTYLAFLIFAIVSGVHAFLGKNDTRRGNEGQQQ